MSEPQQGDQRAGAQLARFIRRASRVLRPSRTGSIAGAAELTAPAPPQAAPEAPSPAAAPAAKEAPEAAPSHPSDRTIFPQFAGRISRSATEHSKLQTEKAEALFSKYEMVREPGIWSPPGPGDSPWTEKTARMRVHRQCHRCQTMFGAEKACRNCSHTRCTKCPRFPPKAAPARPRVVAFAPEVVEGRPVVHKLRVTDLRMPSKGGQDLVRRDPVQRVRRFCHQCDTTFKGKATQCEKCQHQRCPRCTRDP
jgi:hypothetical protein